MPNKHVVDQVASEVGDTVCYCGRPTGQPQLWTWCQWSANAGPVRYGPASAGPTDRKKALEAKPPNQTPCHSEVCPLSHPQSPRLLISLPSFLTHPPPTTALQGLDLTWTQQADHHQTRCNASSRSISNLRRKKMPGYSDWKNQEEDTADQPTGRPVKRWSRGCLLSPPLNAQSIIILSSIT